MKRNDPFSKLKHQFPLLIFNKSTTQIASAIALTAYASSSDRDYALRIGFEKYFSQPIEPQVLVQAIVSLVKEKT
jgi:CheY-like chemotaxis protein